EAGAGFPQHRLGVGQDVAGLPLDRRAVVGEGRVGARFGRHAAAEIAGELPGREDDGAAPDTLGVSGERGGRVRAGEDTERVRPGLRGNQVDLDLAARYEQPLRANLDGGAG